MNTIIKAKSLTLPLIFLLQISFISPSYASVDNSYKNSQGEAFLSGTYLQVGVALNGRFGSSHAAPTGKGFFPTPRGSGKSYARTSLGFIADRNRDSGWIDGDFFLPGSPYEGWYVDVAGTTGKYDNSNGTSGNVGTLGDIQVTSSLASVTHTVTINEVTIAQTYSVPIGSGTFDGDQQLSIRVTITNPTASAKSGIYYARQVDPDNNQDTGGGYSTNNQVEAKYGVSGSAYSLVSATSAASGVSGNSYLGLFSSDARSSPGRNTSGFSAPATARAIYDGTGLVTSVESGRTAGDAGIAMGFSLGTLNAGDSTTFDFAYVLSSTAATQAVAAASAPAAPTGVAENTQIALSWSEPSSADTIVGYRIFQSTDGTNFDSGTDQITNSLTRTITGLTNGTSYYYKVAALTGTSPYTQGTLSSRSDAIVPKTTPGSPTGVTPTRQNSQVLLSWSAPASNGGSALTDYIIEYSTDSGSNWLTFTDSVSTSTSTNVTGLSNGTGYVFRVSAKNVVGPGSPSLTSNEAIPIAPFAFGLALSSTSITAGETVTATITAYISDGVTYSDYGGSAPVITAPSDSAATFATASAWSSGQSTVVITFRTSGTHTVTATSSSLSVNAGPVSVSTGALSKFAISLASSLNENQVATATITAQDTFSNTVTSYSPINPVLSSAASAASFGTLSSWVNGVATVTVSYANNGSRNFVYTDGAISKTVLVTVTLATTPVVTSVSPNSSTTDGGITVTITGSQLTGTTGVTFSGIAATNVTVVSDTQVTVTNPANAEVVAVIVVTTGTGSDVNAITFTYTPTAATVAAREAAAAARAEAARQAAADRAAARAEAARQAAADAAAAAADAAARAEAARQAAANAALAQTVVVQAAPVNSSTGVTGPVTLAGITPTASIFVAAEVKPNIPGFASLKVNANTFEVIPTETFSGKMTVPVIITQNGATITLNVPIVVNPKPVPVAATSPESKSLTNVAWEKSPNAISYKVLLNNSPICESASAACSIPRLLGPNAKLEVLALGNDGTISSQVVSAYIPSKPIPVLDVKFAFGSSRIDARATKQMRDFVRIVQEQGFTKVSITAFTDSIGGAQSGKTLSTARSRAVSNYLNRFLEAKIDATGAGINPIAKRNKPDANARKAQISVM